MSELVEKIARFKQLRNVVLAAVVIPAALVAGCAPQPVPPPPPQPMAYPAPPPPPPGPAPVPYVRG